MNDKARAAAEIEWRKYQESNPPKGQAQFYYKDNTEYWQDGFVIGYEARDAEGRPEGGAWPELDEVDAAADFYGRGGSARKLDDYLDGRRDEHDRLRSLLAVPGRETEQGRGGEVSKRSADDLLLCASRRIERTLKAENDLLDDVVTKHQDVWLHILEQLAEVQKDIDQFLLAPPPPDERVQRLVEAVKRIGAERDCGCKPYCRCDGAESLLIDLNARRDLANEALRDFETGTGGKNK